MSAPLTVASVDEDDRRVEGESLTDGEFDPGAPPPFKLADIRAAIPKHCWVKDPWRSMSYVVRDVAIVLGLAAGAAYLNSWVVWPLYWAAQGTMFWALFVLGHDWYTSQSSLHSSIRSPSLIKLDFFIDIFLINVVMIAVAAAMEAFRITRSSTAWSGIYFTPPFLSLTMDGTFCFFTNPHFLCSGV